MDEHKPAKIQAELSTSLANQHYNAENYETALKSYTEAIDLCPDTAAYYNNRAACHWKMLDHSSALADARHAIRIDPDCETAHVQVAKCCRVVGDILGMEMAVTKVLARDRESTMVDEERKALLEIRRLEPFIKASYDRKFFSSVHSYLGYVLSMVPASVGYRVLKAECLAHLNRYPEALEIVGDVLKQDPTSADAIFVRGLCLYLTDNVESCIQHSETALSLDPDHEKSKQLRKKAKQFKQMRAEGHRLCQMCRFRGAHLVYTEALSIDADNRQINSTLEYNRALVHVRLGCFVEAVEECNNALSLNDQCRRALVLRGQCHNKLEMFQEAVGDFQKALDLEDTSEVQNLLVDASQVLKLLDCYKLLGVERNAGNDVIRKAFHKQAKLHHPDRHLSATDEQKEQEQRLYIEAAAAYETLTDGDLRQQYERGPEVDHNADKEDILRSLFI